MGSIRSDPSIIKKGLYIYILNIDTSHDRIIRNSYMQKIDIYGDKNNKSKPLGIINNKNKIW